MKTPHESSPGRSNTLGVFLLRHARPGVLALAALCVLIAPAAVPALAQEPEAPPESVETAATASEQEPAKQADDKKPKRLKRKEVRELTEALPAKYQQWLKDVEYLISDEELASFFEIDKDHQRDAFIERFWKVRERYPGSGGHLFREEWYQRLQEAVTEFEDLSEDRARIFMLNGLPDARLEFDRCSIVYPLEIWFYRRSERLKHEFIIVFYKKYGGKRFLLWRPVDGIAEIMNTNSASSPSGGGQDFFQRLYTCKDGDVVASVLSRVMHPSNRMDYEMTLAKAERPSQTPDGEWLATFNAYSTDIPANAGTFDAQVSLTYPERYQSRTVTVGTIEIDPAGVARSELGSGKSYNFFLTGEILQETKLFEQFRYRFDLPSQDLGSEKVPLVFERRLRPGDYKLVLKLEDINSQKFFRHAEDFTVPVITVDENAMPSDPETRRILEEANIIIGTEIPTIQLLEPHGTMQVGMVRFDTLATGKGIEEVRFALDGRIILQKRRPPYSVELDLGTVPRTRQLRVSAHDAAGNELTSDELTINAGEHQFSVHLIEPRDRGEYGATIDAEASILTPEGRPVERLEYYYNEDLVATVYQEPWVATFDVPDAGQLGYVRAVAYLPDGNNTDEMVYINAPDYLENLEIQFVELYASALDKDGRPVQDLEVDDFTVIEDGAPQTITRFEKVDNLPIHAEVLIDVSASMEGSVQATQQAALQFFEELLTSRDRAALITFNDHPYLAVGMTNEVDELASGLAGLKAERGTALYDAVVFSLYYMNGLKGQKAMLLLSDGKDEASRFSWGQTLEYARRAGVAIYTIGLDIRGKESGQAKKKLSGLADETGGRAFFIKDVSELSPIYEQIQRELRSRYLIAYQSTNSDPNSGFRSIDLRTSTPGVQAKTSRGYYP